MASPSKVHDLLAWAAILQQLVGGVQFGLKDIDIKPIGAGRVNAITPIVEGNPFALAAQGVAGMGKGGAKAFAYLFGRGVGPKVEADLLTRAVGATEQIEEQFARFGISPVRRGQQAIASIDAQLAQGKDAQFRARLHNGRRRKGVQRIGRHLLQAHRLAFCPGGGHARLRRVARASAPERVQAGASPSGHAGARWLCARWQRAPRMRAAITGCPVASANFDKALIEDKDHAWFVTDGAADGKRLATEGRRRHQIPFATGNAPQLPQHAPDQPLVAGLAKEGQGFGIAHPRLGIVAVIEGNIAQPCAGIGGVTRWRPPRDRCVRLPQNGRSARAKSPWETASAPCC